MNLICVTHSRKFADNTQQSLCSGGYVCRKKFEFEEVLHCTLWCLKFDLGRPQVKTL
jgi:hypothetical protein